MLDVSHWLRIPQLTLSHIHEVVFFDKRKRLQGAVYFPLRSGNLGMEADTVWTILRATESLHELDFHGQKHHVSIRKYQHSSSCDERKFKLTN